MFDCIHRWEDGRIAWGATARYLIALVYPMWDGDAPGRAYTPTEQKMRAR